MFAGLSVLVSFSYFGVDVSLVDGMMFVTIKAAVGIDLKNVLESSL